MESFCYTNLNLHLPHHNGFVFMLKNQLKLIDLSTNDGNGEKIETILVLILITIQMNCIIYYLFWLSIILARSYLPRKKKIREYSRSAK